MLRGLILGVVFGGLMGFAVLLVANAVLPRKGQTVVTAPEPAVETVAEQEAQPEGEAAPNTDASDATASEEPTTEETSSEEPATGDAAPSQEAQPETSTEPSTEPTQEPTGMGESAGSFTDNEDERMSTRLPTVGDAAVEEEPQSDRAIIANGTPFEQAEPGPMLSVVLVDVGDAEVSNAALAAVPFPVAFGLDALAEGAASNAQKYRNAGREVIGIVALPANARPQDVTVTLTEARAKFPNSIGFMDTPEGTYQQSRDVASQVVTIALEEGHGLVSVPSGLNALAAEATRAGSPVGFIFRDFDGQGQDVNAMKRFLDQAAFRATVQGNIIVLGRAKPDTLQALTEWALTSRAQSVSIVPLSYQLLNPYQPAQQ